LCLFAYHSHDTKTDSFFVIKIIGNEKINKLQNAYLQHFLDFIYFNFSTLSKKGMDYTEEYDEDSYGSSDQEVTNFNDYYAHVNELVEYAEWESSEVLGELFSCRDKHANLPALQVLSFCVLLENE
jgi:hypothetical protein